ncbi:cysteine hydrolase [Trebonia kvetii]|uniref:Cysteine hydrolase n=1 Tax=Trebonia kvetii TaxID=2480626 RepID=A0A6P2BLT4_9ACTN|nr:isochorismatase family cysteine hydrolase [Trebonia kvetii]TVY99061.1 cysteine hydrolase [Trebonia kvetii]
MRRHSGLDIPETIEDAGDPATMALIVYDMQAGVLRQLPDDGAEAVERVSRVLTAARAGGYPVFFTRHMSLPVRLMGTAQLRTAMSWQHVDSAEKVQSWFLRDAPGSEIVADLAPRDDEAVFDKLAMSAFAGTPLEMALRDLGVRSVAIVGVALEIGIAPTVSHAVDLGFIPVVVTDACGGRDHTAMQRVLDDFRFSGDALLTDIATITPLLEQV